MPQITYLFNRIVRMDARKMLKKADEIGKKAGKPGLFILLDMVYCGFKYMAGYSDYELFEMYRMDHRQRSSVLTRGKNNRYVASLNSRDGWSKFENKINFLTEFNDYVRRDWIDLNRASSEDFKNFALKVGAFIAKPPEGTHGDGIELIEVTDDTSFDSLYLHLKDTGRFLCEELVVQHPDLSKIYAGSVNTIRAITIVAKGTPHVVAALLRIGNGGRVVDNFNSGGMVVPIDIRTGIISGSAQDKQGNVYSTHPLTGTPISGTQIPYWDACKSLILSAAGQVKDVRYVGWDIAVTPDGPLLIEGNHYPGHDIYGLPAQTPDKIGVLPAFEAVLPLKDLKKL